MSDLTDKIKRSFLQATAVSILLYGCTSWMLAKSMEKKFDGSHTRMLRAKLKRSWKQQPKKTTDVRPPTIYQENYQRRSRHAVYYWRSKDELISDILQWTPSHRQGKVGLPAKTNI